MHSIQSYIGIGSNLGERVDNCEQAIRALEAVPGISSLICSSFYETEPIGDPNQGWFINCVVGVATTLRAEQLHVRLMSIEHGLGRVRTERNAPRTIDLDLLFYGLEIIQNETLTVPHPRMQQRKFVLAPLAEFVPELKHPVLDLMIGELLHRLPASPIVRKMS